MDALKQYLDTDWNAQQKAVAEAVSEFPSEFGLRGHPGLRFRVSERDSFFCTTEGVLIYTHVLGKDGKWLAFAKATPGELRKEITK